MTVISGAACSTNRRKWAASAISIQGESIGFFPDHPTSDGFALFMSGNLSNYSLRNCAFMCSG